MENLQGFIIISFVIFDNIYNQDILYNIEGCLYNDLAIFLYSEIIIISIIRKLLYIKLERLLF